MDTRQCREIHLDVLRENIRLLRSCTPAGTLLMAVVKADAYGHGAVQISGEALRCGADWLAVAAAGEGIQLRDAGITAPILVLGAAVPGTVAAAAAAGITVTVCSADMIRMAEREAASVGHTVEVHLKLDTGMGRIGARTEEEVLAAAQAAQDCPHVRLTGCFTHFADADGDEDGMAFTRMQLERFRRLSALLPSGMIRHCANSAAIHRLMPEAAFDMVRMGISMYGYPPVPVNMTLRPLMRWTAEVTWVKDIQPGDCVSYGRTFRADRPMRVATVSCGYGDGYHRAASGKAQVLIRGRRAPVIGRICMDQMMADVTQIPGVQAGDTVTLIGTDGEETLTAEDLAGWAGTISYEILLAATGRVERVWIP